MRKILRYLILLLIAALPLSALQDFGGELLGDIDGDGQPEMIEWNRFATTDLGDYYQLKVIDDDGTALWRGPKEENPENPYIFAALDYGFSLPELFMDIDGDGFFELLSPVPQSDVSPTHYRRLRWTGKGFVPLSTAVLFSDSSDRENFLWKEQCGDTGIWISQLYPNLSENGWVKADVIEFHGGGTARIGKAYITLDRQGAHVVQWIENSHPPDRRPEPAMVLLPYPPISM